MIKKEGSDQSEVSKKPPPKRKKYGPTTTAFVKWCKNCGATSFIEIESGKCCRCNKAYGGK